MNLVKFYVPTKNSTGDKLDQLTVDYILDMVLENFLDFSTGGTIFEGEGFWKSEDGTVIREKVYRVETLCEDYPPIADLDILASVVKRLVNQEAVLYTVEYGDAIMKFA